MKINIVELQKLPIAVVDDFYGNFSAFLSDSAIEELCNKHSFFHFLTRSNLTTSKEGYLNDKGYSPLAEEHGVLTGIFWQIKEPKIFTGGELIFNKEIAIECMNNRCVLFPSIIPFEIIQINMPNEYVNHNYGAKVKVQNFGVSND